MPAPRKFEEATRARAVRLSRDRREEHGDSVVEARRQVGALLDKPGHDPQLSRGRGTAAGSRPALSRQADVEEVRVLKRGVAELERANGILKAAVSVLSSAELDRRLQ